MLNPLVKGCRSSAGPPILKPNRGAWESNDETNPLTKQQGLRVALILDDQKSYNLQLQTALSPPYQPSILVLNQVL